MTTGQGVATRAWTALCQYPDRKPFHFGTVMAPSEMTALVELTALMEKRLDAIFPSRPVILQLIPGIVWFVPENPDPV